MVISFLEFVDSKVSEHKMVDIQSLLVCEMPFPCLSYLLSGRLSNEQ